jgi:apurinic endonuclease APN1
MEHKLVGTHISSFDEIKNAFDADATIVQLFAPNNKMEIKYKNELDKYNLKSVIHISYSINLAKEWDEYSWWIVQFIKEIEIAHKINSFAVVIHLGKQMELTKEEAYNNMYTCLLYVHEETKQYSSVKILLETSTGQGSELCFKMDDFAHFFKKLSKHPNKEIKNRFGICLDTCHIFAAGYNIKSKDSITMFLDTFEEMIGIKHIKLIHLNDSKNDIGSQLDRHESIDKGYIKINGLSHIIRFFKKLNVPIILETPNDSYKTEIKKYLL